MYFYLSMECDDCEEDIRYGPCLTTLEAPSGMPIIPYDIAAQQMFECGNCGALYATGDFDTYQEREGSLPEDDE